MSRNPHEQAQEMLAAAVAGDPQEPQQRWLQDHLRECAACHDYGRAVAGVVSALRSQPFAADPALVRATILRVRSHALDRRQRRSRNWLVGLSCSFVILSAAITTPLFWRAFGWLGSWAGVSDWVWQMGFAIFWMLPAPVASMLLLARRTNLMQNLDTPLK